MRRPGEVQGYAVSTLQQRRPSGEGLSAEGNLSTCKKLCCYFLCPFPRLLIGLEPLIKTRDTQVRQRLTLIYCDKILPHQRGESLGESSINQFIWSPDKYSSQFGGGSQYAYFHEEDETSFQLVDTAKTQKTAYQRNRMRFAQVRPSRRMLNSSSLNLSKLLKQYF